MNSLVSYDWLKHYVKLAETPEEFSERVSLSGPAVERIMHPAEMLNNIVVGHVIELKKHPKADKLQLAVTDLGKKKLTLVCGGKNLKEDQWVAVALPGAMIRWHGEGDLVKLETAEIRGVKSEGMIAAADEIGLQDAFPHEEGDILDLGVYIPEMKMKPGTLLANALAYLGDAVLDIEVTSNRPDAMGMVGMAREAAAILDREFIWKVDKLPKSTGKKVSVKVAAPKLCPRYMAAKIEGVKVGPSPWWLRKRLALAGLNSINNIVDITNYVLLELAQPLHAFDFGTVNGGINIRLARAGEKIKALDGKNYKLEDTMLVIADDKKPIAVAGIMGGEETGITDKTTSIILEAASFDSVSIRKTSRKLNLLSDSQQLFEKGLSTEAPQFALARAIELVIEVAGGKLAGAITDVQAEKYKPKKFSITSDEINSLIGVTLLQKDMVAILNRLGFKTTTSGKKINAIVPWWRDHDIEMARDLVEEVARVYGYANIPGVVPMDLATRPMDPELVWEDRLREVAKGAGMTETYSYSFVSENLLKKADYNPTEMLHLQNPLTKDLEIMRTTLLPSLLQIANENKERESELRLFEVANVYYPRAKDLPDEQLELGALFNGMPEAWKVAKGFVEHILLELGIRDSELGISWRRLSKDSFWHAGRTVQAFVNEELVATVGEVSPKIAARFKLEGPVALVDMPLEILFKFATTTKRCTPVSEFPVAKRDLAVVVDSRVEFDDIAREIQRSDELVSSVQWFDTFKGKGVPAGKKSVAMHIECLSPERTLESKEVDGLMNKVQLRLKEKFKAEIRS
ncbi:phenylalanine--tRNA ligase subunit beta [Patescibacteria group bacterium]|nr:phenylalanine--tRNA ligase subunit beta [Patescibacteria group bacterium]